MRTNNQTLDRLELYLHIPFCVRKCEYCDFLSGPATEAVRDRYIEALAQELKGRSAECAAYEVDTVFIGGGTPSVVRPEQIAGLMQLIRTRYHLSANAEITMELNPGTVDADKLKSYRQCGINRLSIGLQSADDAELKKLGRIHNFSQFLETYRQVRDNGFANVNVDLMSALPEQTLASYQKSLQAVLSLTPPPEHISAYSLIIEEGTPFYQYAQAGSLKLPDEETERQMYELTGELLAQAGYHRYEISNYAKTGYACRHNCGYWKRTEYLGFGIGAASLMKEQRFCNTDQLEQYIASPLEARGEVQQLSVQEQMEEFMFLGLRMTEGVSAEAFCRKFGQRPEEIYGEVLQKNIADGLLEMVPLVSASSQSEETVETFYRLTARGLDLSNYVMAQFLF